jgi:polyhydroxyalkanoate synthesis regulator phasin
MDTDELHSRIRELEQWVRDLQSGMYINCVYCGHRYGPKEGTPVSMADVLKEHIEVCPRNPMSKLKEENEELRARLDAFEDDVVRMYRNHCSR